MKAILVIDMPNECSECPLFYDYLRCRAKEGVDIYGEERPYNCPLKPLPNKREEEFTTTFGTKGRDAMAEGWNACLEEIMGETE